MRWIMTTWLVAGAAAGCGSDVKLQDDFSHDVGEWRDDDEGNQLHGPYVVGSLVELRASGIDPESDECARWKIDLEDSPVLTTDEDLGCRHRVRAAAAGSTRVRLREDGSERASAEVEVTRPDALTVHARGPLLVGLPDGDGPIERARVLVDGLATFSVRWWQGERELSGRALEASASDGLRIAPLLGMPLDNSWIQVTPRTSAPGLIEIGFEGEVLATLAIEPVAADALVDLTLFDDEDQGTLLAVARDVDGEPVFGVEADWSVDGTSLEGEGDLLRYEPDDGDMSTVDARAEGLDAEIEIALHDPAVGSSNTCAAVGGGSPGGGGVAAALVGLAALLTRRRRA